MKFYDIFGDYKEIESFTNNQNKLEETFSNLQSHWNKIFPDGNRNSGGVQFFKYIVSELNPSIEEFNMYNKFYCGVSGSIVMPQRIINNSAHDFVRIKHINGKYYCGNYYRCCWPCSCDIMNENLSVLAEDLTLNLRDGNLNITVLTINDPCANSKIINNIETLTDPSDSNKPWNQVSSFKCQNKSTSNGYKTNSGRLVFAVLFDAKECSLDEYKMDNFYNKELNENCLKRKNKDDPLSNWGMGDIFINLAS